MQLKRKYKNALICFYFIIIVDSGWCLECFVCHSKQDRDCLDPFDGNRTDLVSCQRVREVGLGIIAASAALGASPGNFEVLSQPPHVCYKLNLGTFLIRGCGKTEVCQNYTETDCLTCNTDGCNVGTIHHPLNLLIFVMLTPRLFTTNKF